jgi:hypothetical protein
MPEFDYLNGSSRPEAERVRSLLDEWCSFYPHYARAELIARLRTRSDVSHMSAVFELTVHELLRRSGASITLHPKIPRARGRPDFLVKPATAPSYYLEVTLAFESAGDDAGEKRLAQLYDILDRIESPDFFIGVSSKGLPSAPLKAGAIRRKLQQWLDTLDHSQITKALASEEEQLPELSHTESGLSLVFTAFPKRNQRAGTRAIGSEFPGVRWSTVPNAIKSRFSDKAGKYGKPGIPLVIAVNAFGSSVDRDDIMDALFGKIAVLVNRMTGATRPTRTPEGFWYGPEGKQNTRVSAVIWTSGLTAWNLANRALEYVPNPWADPQLLDLALPVTRLQWRGNGFTADRGIPIGDFVGLPSGWPE